MESSGDYVNNFLKYIDSFIKNIRPDDPLPVRAPSYKVTESEIDGQIIDIVYHYLNSRECPPYLRNLVAHRVWNAIRNPSSNSRDEDEGCDVIDHGNQTFESMKLIQDVTGRANNVIKELKSSLTRSDIELLPRYLPVSQYAIKNTRRRMEDRHVLIQDLNTLYNLDPKIFGCPHGYYGVFDGHAGEDAAVYSAALLHQYLMQNPFYETDPVQALKHAFYITDTNFIKKADKERLKGGTTAVVALVREKRLVVAWLGDSLALLVRKRRPVHIVQPHKPETPTEKKRIEDMGGFVANIQGTWRVLGQLAVSRAIGDPAYKPYVSSECDIKSLEICGDEDFLILACDGLWDNLSPERAVNIVYAYLLKNNGDTDGVGRSLVETARSAGSEDNITAVVVFLRPVGVLMEEETARISQGQVPEAESFVMTQKDAPPPSFNAIFSPPENFNSTMNPSPAEVSIPKDENGMLAKANEEPEVPPIAEIVESPSQDYDSDEGVGIDITVEKTKNDALEADGNPTDEEVDAALAELDSIPDGGCEVGEVEEEEDEEEEWSYFKMEPQHQQVQSEDFIVPDSSKIAADKVPFESESSHELNEDQVITKERTPPPTPPAPSSPRTVEGFVTSVELNTPEESYNTNLAINQSTEYFNGGQIEQNSGPFSVYVSSSPEPASIETSPVNLHSPMLCSNPLLPEIVEKLQGEEIMEVQSPGASVEIVHAQSTVEVMSDSPVELEIPSPLQGTNPLIENISPIPDIMTQSFTGEILPTEPYADNQAHIDQLQKSLGNIYEEENKENVNILDQLSPQQNEPFSDSRFVTDDTPVDDCSFIQTNDTVNQLQTTTLLENYTDTASMEVVQNDVSSQEYNQSFITCNTNDLEVDVDTHHELKEPEEVTYEAEASDSQAHFEEKINKAFEEPLDQMTSSFHEGTSMHLDVSSSTEIPFVEIEANTDQEYMKPISDEPAVQELSDKLSEIEVEEKEVLPVSDAAAKTDVKTPTSAPRTSVNKSAPPKPSPRSIDSKPSSKAPGSSLNATSTTKRPSSLIAAPKLQKKVEPSKVPSTTTNKSRLATSTSRLSSQPQRLSTSKPLSAAPKTKPATSVLHTKPKTSLSQTGASSAPKTTTTLASRTRPISSTTTTTARSRLPNTSATTGTKRLPTATKSVTSTAASTTTTSTRTAKSSGIPNGIPQTSKTTKSTTSSRTTLSTTRRPLTAKPTTTTTTTSTTRPTSAPSTNRSLTSTTKSSTSTLKQKSTTTSSSPSTKETKNTANRLLSTSRATTTTSKSLVGAKSSTTQIKSKITTKMTKTPGLKSKKEVDKSIVKNTDSAIANGENKITEEESSVEVKEKLVQEEVVLKSEEVSESLVEKTEETITSATETILVNGDH